MLLHIDVWRCAALYSYITFFIFAVLDARTSVAVNMCINCSFFTLILINLVSGNAVLSFSVTACWLIVLGLNF